MRGLLQLQKGRKRVYLPGESIRVLYGLRRGGTKQERARDDGKKNQRWSWQRQGKGTLYPSRSTEPRGNENGKRKKKLRGSGTVAPQKRGNKEFLRGDMVAPKR